MMIASAMTGNLILTAVNGTELAVVG